MLNRILGGISLDNICAQAKDKIFKLIQCKNYCIIVIVFRAFTLHIEKCVKPFDDILTLLVIPEKQRWYLKCGVDLSVYLDLMNLVMF